MNTVLGFVLGLLLLVPARAGEVRVVSQTVGCDEMLLSLAEPAQIAALSHLSQEAAYSCVAEQAKAYPHLLPNGDAEGILKFKPTVVLFADYSRAELVAQVRRAGVRVVIFDKYKSLDDAYASLEQLARELGPEAEKRCAALLLQCRTRVAALEKALAGVPRVKVIAPSTYGLIAGSETTFQDLCDHAGAENVAFTVGHLVGHAPPPTEAMLTWPVEMVVLSGASVDAALAPYKSYPPFNYMTALKQRRIALLHENLLGSVTHYRIDGYERLAHALHPDLIPDPR